MENHRYHCSCALTTLLSDVPTSLVIIAMFILQFILNFFIPSGSGQALTTMPLMVPISDLLHINRQLTVLAFQYGDAIVILSYISNFNGSSSCR